MSEITPEITQKVIETNVFYSRYRPRGSESRSQIIVQQDQPKNPSDLTFSLVRFTSKVPS
jgi:hypothetical protein